MQLGSDITTYYQPYKNLQNQVTVTTVGHQTFTIDQRYEIIDQIGQGSYGTVVAATVKQTNKKQPAIYAIKKSKVVFDHKIYARSMLRQLKILRLLNHENILGVKTLVLPQSRKQFNDIYIVSQMMDTDLSVILDSGQKLSYEHECFFLYQILRALKYIHSANIIHRDLKPMNILINAKCDIKICDFGLARRLDSIEKTHILTQYMMTRYYRAPQILLSVPIYDTSADIWSVGCIFAQILGRKKLFRGSSTQNQIEKVCELIQIPDLSKQLQLPRKSQQLLMLLAEKKAKAKDFKGLEGLFPEASSDAIDLLKRLLSFNPKTRITAKEALAHPYFKDLHQEKDEPERAPLDPIDFEFEDYDLTTQQLKDLLYEQILLYHFKDFYISYQSKKAKKQSLIGHVIHNSNAKNIDPSADQD